MFRYQNGEESEKLRPTKDLVKWTNGEKYEKSLRKKNDDLSGITNQTYNENSESLNENNSDNNKNQYHDDRFIQQGFVLKQNKRDAFNDKLLERGFHTQLSQNPFLSGGNYISDIEVEDNFLRPKNTNTISVDMEKVF